MKTALLLLVALGIALVAASFAFGALTNAAANFANATAQTGEAR
jgi:hypothetical protein